MSYLSGFMNFHETEAVEGALPKDRNSPQIAPLGLYAEQINNSAFTAPRIANFKAWQYRIRPSVSTASRAKHIEHHLIRDQFNPDSVLTPPEQFRWDPLPTPTQPHTVIQSLTTMAYNSVSAIHLYHANQSMTDSYFFNADGDFLFVPQHGRLTFKTEMGLIEAAPNEIVVIPRGIRYQIELNDPTASGYICELQAGHFALPERGPIGANGLAEERHFLAPKAWYENRSGDFNLYSKFQGQLWQSSMDHSPLNVVAWHGNFYPYKYDLKLFCSVNNVLKDHADPSIFTVLSSASAHAGTANVDFVIFPERWSVCEDTFRPPYYHRNIMSEFMGLIQGVYDAKQKGFVPGGSSLHNTMLAHGPDKNTFDKASHAELKPERYINTLAFMFESRESFRLTSFALNSSLKQDDYLQCWKNLDSQFSG